MKSEEDANRYARVLAGLVWRSLALLSQPAAAAEMAFPRTRRPKLAGAGIRAGPGIRSRSCPTRWSGLRAAGRQPRQPPLARPTRPLAATRDGRRVFVRACEVGDPERGGV